MDKYSKYYKSQKEATSRYNKKAYDRINVVVPKGKRELIKEFAASQGKSLNRFICDAINEKMSEIALLMQGGAATNGGNTNG